MLADKDRRLLKELQNDFPLCERPFAVVAEKYGLTEDGLLKKLRRWKKAGLIRYLGAIFNTRALGICSTLVAMKVAARDVPRVARIINGYPQVSHNYLRSGPYNLWFTLSAPSRARLRRLFAQIRKETKARAMLDLATKRVFKIDARFDLSRLR